jgi:hypothetical protein
MDIARAALHLVPDASFAVEGDTITQWRGSANQPSPAQLTAAWAILQQQDAAEATAAQTAAANELTIGQQVEAALAANQQGIAQLVAWRTTGPGAGTANLTAAQMSQALRTSADNQVAAFRQLNGLIRLVRRQLSTADLNSAAKANPTT